MILGLKSKVIASECLLKSIAQCQYSFQFRPTSYKWKKKDGELPLLAKVDDAFLHFETLNKSDNGVYLCLAENSIGNSEEEYILRVQGTH